MSHGLHFKAHGKIEIVFFDVDDRVSFGSSQGILHIITFPLDVKRMNEQQVANYITIPYHRLPAGHMQ